jgi:hypothetical protein
MKKEQVINKIEQAWAAFQDSYAGLTDEQILEPGVTGDWSVRDILAHVTWWEAEALKHLPLIMQGGRPPRYADLYGGIDAFNAQMTERKRRLKLSEVRYQLDKTHLRLLEYLQSVPEEQFASETRFRKRLRLDTYRHYPLHTQAIIEWRMGK